MLDQFLGSGTTLIEANLLGRNAVGVDINPDSIKLSSSNLHFTSSEISKIYTREGNARKLSPESVKSATHFQSQSQYLCYFVEHLRISGI